MELVVEIVMEGERELYKEDTGDAVSYTHLDVYKRQIVHQRRS